MLHHRLKDALIMGFIVVFMGYGIVEASYGSRLGPIQLQPFLFSHHHTASAVVLRLVPNPAIAGIGGSPTDVSIVVDAGLQQIDAVQIRLTFDPAKVMMADADGNDSNGVQLAPSTTLTQVLQNTINNTAGTIDFAVGRSTGQSAPTGVMTLGVLKIRGVAVGTSSLSFDPSRAEVSFDGATVPTSLMNGSVQVVAQFVELTPGSGSAGTTVLASGSHFTAGQLVQLRWDSSVGPLLASTTVGSDGAFTATVTIPSDASVGPHSIWAVSAGNNLATTPFTVSVRLRLDPDPARAGLNTAAQDVRIMLESGNQALDAVELQLTFDPTKLQIADADSNPINGIQILPGTAFQQVLGNSVNNDSGTIDFAAGRTANQPVLSGSVHLATIGVRGLAEGTWPLTFLPSAAVVAFSGVGLPVSLDDGAVQVASKLLAFTAQPIRSASGFVHGVQPVVALWDGQGNVFTGDNATEVTLSIKAGSGASGSALTCNQTSGAVTGVTLAGGVATFTGCTISPSGTGYVLEATAAGVTAGQSDPFNVTWAGDTNGDCRVSVVDFSLIVTHFGKTSAHPDWTGPLPLAYRADLNGDGRISILDFSIVVSRFGQMTASCAPPSNGNPAPGS